jgi:hypothetical protein
MLAPNRKENQAKQRKLEQEKKEAAKRRVYVPFCSILFIYRLLMAEYRTQVASSLFLTHNTALAPPYRVLIDTNFINFSLQNKLELVQGMMDCLYAKCVFIAPKEKHHASFAHLALTPCLRAPRHTMCHRLRNGRVGETWAKISDSSTVRWSAKHLHTLPAC